MEDNHLCHHPRMVSRVLVYQSQKKKGDEQHLKLKKLKIEKLTELENEVVNNTKKIMKIEEGKREKQRCGHGNCHQESRTSCAGPTSKTAAYRTRGKLSLFTRSEN